MKAKMAGMVFCLLLSHSALADDETFTQITQSLFQSVVVYPQAKGEVQLTFFPQYFRGRSVDWTGTPIYTEYGITDRLQVELAWAGYLRRNPSLGKTTSGVGDWGLAAQYSFMQINHTNYSAAIGFYTEFPSASINKQLTDGFRQYQPYAVFAKDLPAFHNMQIFIQPALTFYERVKRHANPANDSSAATEFDLNSGFFGPLGSAVYSLELNWDTNTWNHNGSTNELYLTPGLAYNFSHHFEVGLGVPVGLNHGADRYRVIGMMVASFDT